VRNFAKFNKKLCNGSSAVVIATCKSKNAFGRSGGCRAVASRIFFCNEFDVATVSRDAVLA